jgi:hypothetical protein
MKQVKLKFDIAMTLPADATGFTITDDSGGTFTATSVLDGTDGYEMIFGGTWAPDEPVHAVDAVTVVYDDAVGSVTSLGGAALVSFTSNIVYAEDVYKTGSIYSGTKTTLLAGWLYEKLATGVNIVTGENATSVTTVGFVAASGDTPVVTYDVPLTTLEYIFSTNAYVAWQSAADGTFDLEQSVT